MKKIILLAGIAAAIFGARKLMKGGEEPVVIVDGDETLPLAA